MVKDIVAENDFDFLILLLWETINSWGWRKFIPLDECFEMFNVPDLDRLWDRVSNNIIYYRTNYLALYALFLMIVGASSPKFAMITACIFIMWILPFIIVPHPFIISEYRVTPSCIVLASSLVTILSFLTVKSFFTFHLFFHLFYLLIVILHATFRNDSLKSILKVGLNEKIKQVLRE